MDLPWSSEREIKSQERADHDGSVQDMVLSLEEADADQQLISGRLRESSANG